MGGQLGAETRRAVIFSKIAENLRCQAVISRGARVTEAHLLGERSLGVLLRERRFHLFRLLDEQLGLDLDEELAALKSAAAPAKATSGSDQGEMFSIFKSYTPTCGPAHQ